MAILRNRLTIQTTQLMLPSLRQPASRQALNFVRRYKWAFRPEYAKLCPQVAAPDLSAFARASVDVLKDEQEPLRLHFERARDELAELSNLPAGVAGPWHEDRLQVIIHRKFLTLFATYFFLFFLRGCSISIFHCWRTCARSARYDCGVEQL